MKSIRAVIFDADGMVIHGERFSKRLAESHGITTTMTRSFFENEFQSCLIGKADLKVELSKYLESWGWKSSVENFVSLWFDDDSNKLDERVLAVAQDLRHGGIKVCLATNNEQYRTRDLAVRRGLETQFDHIFSSCEIGAKKPEAAFFEHIRTFLDLEKNEIFFWDDDIENIQGAEDFGFESQQYLDFDRFKQIVGT